MAVMATAAAVPTNMSTIRIATTLIIVSFFMMSRMEERYKNNITKPQEVRDSSWQGP